MLRVKFPFMIDDATRSHLQLQSQTQRCNVPLHGVVHWLLVFLDERANRKSGDRMAQVDSSPLLEFPTNR